MGLAGTSASRYQTLVKPLVAPSKPLLQRPMWLRSAVPALSKQPLIYSTKNRVRNTASGSS